MDITEDLYDTLNITREANTEQIINAYNNLYTTLYKNGASRESKEKITFVHGILGDNSKSSIWKFDLKIVI